MSRAFDIAMLGLIVLNVLAVIVETIEGVGARVGGFLKGFEVFSVAVFTAEYALRIWSCVSEERYRRAVRGRLRLIVEPMSVVDLLAILPFYLPFWNVDFRFIRVFRMMRVARLAKVARYYSALLVIKNVFVSRKEELVLTSTVMLMLLVVASSLMYYCENHEQPE